MKLTIPITPELRVRLLHAENIEIEVPDTAVPEGWQLVPVKPTEDMLDEFDSIVDYGAEDSEDAWRRMLAAAPKLEGGAV